MTFAPTRRGCSGTPAPDSTAGSPALSHRAGATFVAALRVVVGLAGIAAVAGACLAPERSSGPRPVLAAGKERLTFETAVGPEAVRFSGSAPRIGWSDDGTLLVRRDDESVVHIDPDTREEVPVEDLTGEHRGRITKAFEALDGFDTAEARRAGRRVSASRLRRQLDERILVEHEGDLFVFDPAEGGDRVVRVTTTEPPEREGELSPDGRFVAFVRDNDLYFVDVDSGSEVRATEGGGEELFHGRLDWVYQEEIYGRGNFKGFWWSPNSDAVTFLRLDESPVGEFTVVDHVPVRLDLEVTNYPKAGDPNPIVSVGVARPSGGEPVWLDLSEYEPTDLLVVCAGWTPEGDRVVLQVQNRIQNRLDLLFGDPASGEVERILRETSDSWVDVEGMPRWLDDGTFLWTSSRTGYRHVYRYRRDGQLVGAVTSGDWEVRDVLRVDEEAGLLWFVGSADGPVNDHVYRIRLNGTERTRLTRDDGSHSVTFNSDASLFLDSFSSLTSPPELRLCNAEGDIVDLLGRASIPALERYAYGYRDLVQIPTRDGFAMDATILVPPDFEGSKKYPVWLETYAGPNAPRVRNRWNGDAWHQFLAHQGFIVFQVNNRTSSRAGHTFISTCYRQLGVQELADIEDAVRWLTRKRWTAGATAVS